MALAAVLAFVSCVEEISSPEMVSSELYAQIEHEDQTRTMMDENNNIRWSEGDQILAFMKTSLGLKYQIKDEYIGKTSGYFSQVTPGSSNDLGAGMEWNHNVVYYPYSSTVECEKSGSAYSLSVVLPSEQIYAEESFGNGTFPMVAVSESNNITFRNACGGLKLQLKGTVAIASIKVEGRTGEKLSGKATVTAYTEGTVPAINMASDASTSVILNCGSGVLLNEETATEFIISLPPVTFTKGFTVTITDTAGGTQTIETSKENVVLRSSLLKMPEVECHDQSTPANNQIFYTNGSTSKASSPKNANALGAKIISNLYDTNRECWVITFDADVTSIGDEAFYWCGSIESITLPNSVTAIGNSAFQQCYSLASINIPDNVTSIGNLAFEDCRELTEIIVPNSVGSIGYRAFNYCSNLTYVTIGENVASIDYGAFAHCQNLLEFRGKFSSCNGRCLIIDNTIIAYANASGTDFSIPSNVTSIGKEAFDYCDALEKVIIPDSVIGIGMSAFVGCTSLSNVIISDNLTSIEYGAFSGCTSLSDFTIPDSLTEIGAYAFCDCSSLTAITIPSGVSSISRLAFSGCTGLTTLAISDGVTTIGECAFEECKKLTAILLPNSVRTIEQGAFYNCCATDQVTVPNSVTKIMRLAFYNCSGELIVNCDIPSGSYDDYGAFYHAKFSNVIIGEDVTEIGDYAFSNCASITDITISDHVTKIGYHAFEDCTGLTCLEIPDSVTSISYGAFQDCTNLTTVCCLSIDPPGGTDSMFDNNAPDRKIYVPVGSGDKYKAASGWSTYKDYIVEISR